MADPTPEEIARVQEFQARRRQEEAARRAQEHREQQARLWDALRSALVGRTITAIDAEEIEALYGDGSAAVWDMKLTLDNGEAVSIEGDWEGRGLEIEWRKRT